VTEPELFNRSPGVLTVYADLACPFASFALGGLRAARDRLGADVRFDVRAFALELVNERPHDLPRLESEKVGGLAASDELDAALRRAMYVDSRCIALLPVILEVAEECPDMDRAALASLLHSGACRAELFTQLSLAERETVNGSPHVFGPDGRDWFNPGVTLEHAGDYAVVKSYEPAVYDEVVLAACQS
jgi:predicted DsbA family dithiol-disulfide isomerase